MLKASKTDTDRKDRIQPPPGNLTPSQAMLNAASSAGFSFCCYYDFPEDPDYRGPDPVQAWEAITACELMNVLLIHEDPAMYGTTSTGTPITTPRWAMIIHENEEDDLSDFHAEGWINDWWDENYEDML